MKHSILHLADCNRCNNHNCKGLGRNYDPCKIHSNPKEGFTLAELALAHPQGLHEALSALPFKTNLEFTL